MFPDRRNQSLAAAPPHCPELLIGNGSHPLCKTFRHATPTLLSTAFRPQPIGMWRIPGRNVDAIGHVRDRHLTIRPARKERLKYTAAELTVKPAHAQCHRRAAL